ncbi:DsbA family protein [Paraburkholderia sp. D15]|uniref:DsbA family protein n=1 Tax=Paraburkholderia sp. D15 TaxID=2880218 RepID=UPI00247B0EA9|nr:DsbA family protein [Paraburkholderia sp. D15]WGS52786.1 DsbA family protein [Paraburkholderia sp. D15]
MATLHYIYDPLCGWCYGAAPLVAAARGVPGLTVVAHGGGMLAGPQRRGITPQWRSYVMPHDRRIAELTGQPFGDAYFDGLLRDEQAVMDSEPPITAALAAQALDGRGLDMIHRVQRAHYEEGRRISEVPVLEALATEIGLPADAFRAEYARQAGAATQQHIDASRRLLDAVGGRGFPTFALEDADGRVGVIDAGAFLGQPVEWARELARVAAV